MVDTVSLPQSPANVRGAREVALDGDEIDLLEVLSIFWESKWLLVGIVFVFSSLSVIYALRQPNYYRAEALLIPSSSDQRAMSAGLSGLANLAGINLGGAVSTDNSKLALHVLKSRAFIGEFIKKHKLEPPLAASVSWDMENKKWIYDPSVYDEQSGMWLEGRASSNTSYRPTDWDLYEKFIQSLSVEESDGNTDGTVRLSIISLSPEEAQRWVGVIVDDLNQFMRERDIREAKKSIQYLELQLAKSNVTEMRNIFYQLIEEQTKTIMLAEVREGYVFKVVDPAVVPKVKAGPKRSGIIMLSTFLGAVLGIIFVLARHALRIRRGGEGSRSSAGSL